MKQLTLKRCWRMYLLLPAFFLLAPQGFGQAAGQAVTNHLYRPRQASAADTLRVQDVQPEPVPEHTSAAESSPQVDTTQVQDDLFYARMKFIEDSLRARELFVRDSIALRKKRIKDSLDILIAQLPRLLDASYKAYSEDIIFRNSGLKIVGDTALDRYENCALTFDFSSPFTPWKTILDLSGRDVLINMDPASGRITSLQAPGLNCSYIYGKNNNVLVLQAKGSLVSRPSGKLFKEPLDSVFFSTQGRVVKIKKYVQFYTVANNYHKGNKLFTHLTAVKQFSYDASGELTLFEVTRFCDRWQPQDALKVCNIISHTITRQGNTYRITRKNNPVNDFSDGTFIYEFSEGNTLSSVSFENDKKTESWKTIIEVNEAGHVSSYLYQGKDGIIRKTLLINYYLHDPKAKNKVETITCVFEDDGISYFQQNNTTGKSRSRDKLTMEWSEWR